MPCRPQWLLLASMRKRCCESGIVSARSGNDACMHSDVPQHAAEITKNPCWYLHRLCEPEVRLPTR